MLFVFVFNCMVIYYYCTTSANCSSLIIRQWAIVQMLYRAFETFHMTSTIPLWHQAGPDTVNHSTLALSMVSLFAVVVMTLQHVALWYCSIRCCVNKEPEGRQREGETEGGRGGGRIKWGQLLLKDEPHSQSCLCHMILGVQLSRRRADFEDGERFGERKSGKTREHMCE